ncbi:multiple epidermal growth factor-like domains protein 10 [Haliotis asinina]|uniref:multiple epidermal growth factor-like domains protein 10 n=1 Tax=Haliotis asinina TaxID=109174 RepID=UPI0035327ECC
MEVSVLGVSLCVSMLDMVSGICPEGTYGYECGYQCHCPADKCNATNGCSPGDCDIGWSGMTCQKSNMALNKPTSASSVYQDPGNAVNGDNSAHNYHQCFHSELRDSSVTQAWWRVDLEENVKIRHVTIFFRIDYKVRRNGIQIYIADTAASPTGGVNCYNVTGNRDGTDIPDVLTAMCSGEGRYLVLYTTTVNNESDNMNVPVMDFCEVEVDVCSNGTFGDDCDNYCHCDGEVCDYVDGICPDGVCLPGWTTEKCDTECEFGYYGVNCNKDCLNRNCKGDNSSCVRVTGQCDGGCTAGWNGTDCTQKCLRSYGDGCSKYCSDRKCVESSSDSCDHVTGGCEGGCRGGWKGTDCTEACILGIQYGANCEGYCSTRRCEDRVDSCPKDTGRCESGCQSGWKGEDCTQVCISGTFGDDCDNYCHCDGEVCDYVDGICPSGVCLPGWTTEKCDTVCEFGHYGANCRMACPNRNCKGDNSSCDRVTGKCDGGCEAGWNGTDCTLKCLRSYGDGCSKYCSDRKCAESSSDSCDHVTGMCEDGCSSGWKGIDCTEACIQGVEYGANCVGNCRARMCEEGADVCPQDTGRCESGCQSGWKGQDCTQRALDVNSITNLSASLLGALSMLVFMALVMGAVCLRRKKTYVKKWQYIANGDWCSGSTDDDTSRDCSDRRGVSLEEDHADPEGVDCLGVDCWRKPLETSCELLTFVFASNIEEPF